MDGENRRLVPLTLSDGVVVHIEALEMGERQKVGVLDASFDQIVKVVSQVSSMLASGLKAAAPQKASVEFGLEIALEPSGLTAVICRGKTTANLTVVLEWSAEGGKPE
jgi:Trypsin-co-occurring domain 1